MTFLTESTKFEKTALSDLQGAWINLREAVVENYGFEGSDKMLVHIDEAMSWESVRNLTIMKNEMLLLSNIAIQYQAPEDILLMLEDV